MTPLRSRPALLTLASLLTSTLLGLAGCSEEPVGTSFSLHGADEVAIVCRNAETATGLPLAQCAPGGEGSLHALVTSVARSELAAIRLAVQDGDTSLKTSVKLLELDPTVPGITHLELGPAPLRLLPSPDGRLVYTLSNGRREVWAIDVGRLCVVGRVPWGPAARGALSAADLALDEAGGLLISFPTTGVVAHLATGACGFLEGECGATGEVPVNKSCSPTIFADLRTLSGGIGLDLSPGVLVWRPALGDGGPGSLLVGDALLDLTYELVATADAGVTLGKVMPISPECGDGLDNDGDGATDLADPECSSEGDGNERRGLAPPACADGIDNDGDGLVDLDDPGCLAGGYTLEDGPYPVPRCGNGIDDDEDGLTDTEDPGCAHEDGRDETDPPASPACANGTDDDGDGLIDLLDPGCAGAGDTSEVGPLDASGKEQLPACANGLDDDHDGLIDGQDPGCSHPGDLSEWTRPTACSDGLDNDADGLVDLADPGCWGPGDLSEASNPRQPAAPPAIPPACADGLDDDGDGLVDLDDPDCRAAGDLAEAPDGYPCSNGRDDDGDRLVDLEDPGCSSPTDPDEAPDPDSPTACSNGRDDDGDGLVDLEDPGCQGAGDVSELAEAAGDPPGTCANGLDDDLDGLSDEADVWCILTAGTGDEAHKPACADGRDNDGDGLTDFRPALTAGAHAPTPVRADPGCQGFHDTRERTPAPCASRSAATSGRCTGPGDPRSWIPTRLYPCTDGLDNDGDGLIDAQDPGCTSAWDQTEGPEGQPLSDEELRVRRAADRLLPELLELATPCSDGLDNDGDGLTDLADPGCAAAGDAAPALVGTSSGMTADALDEGGTPGTPAACANGVDDDGDGLADYPDDPDCPGPGWDNEAGPWRLPACSNDLDDDGDGLRDLEDPDCLLASSDGERVTPLPASCWNRRDDDGDGATDLQDPDCQAGRPEIAATSSSNHRSCLPLATDDPWCAADPEEPTMLRTSPIPLSALPACANGRDDDGDGLIDAEDAGCSGPLDDREVESPGTQSCDALDLILSPECAYAGGDATIAALPAACSNGLDDDGDGLVDESDEGCAGEAQDREWLPPPPPACRDGASNGLTLDLGDRYTLPAEGRYDLASPGCFDASDPLEAPRSLQPDCSNGVDDDGDGLTDLQDPGCFGPGDDNEADGTILPSCADGLDNDGDEAVDAQDPDCHGGAGGRETPFRAAGVAGGVLTPDGRFLYVLHRWQRAVVVIDLASGLLVDTRQEEPFHSGRGVLLASPPSAIALSCSRPDPEDPLVTIPEICQPDSPDVLALVTRKDGILSAIQVKKGGVDVHRVADATPDDAPRVSSLKLVDPEGEALPTSPAPPTWFPAPSRHPASHGADGAAGVTLQHRLGPDNALGLQPGPGLLQNRTWQAVWEGEIPGAASTWGRFDPELPGVLHDQKRDFCLAGVVPGDRLILLSRVEKSATLGRDCALLFDEQALQGREGFEYCIREVSPHTLWLQAVPADGTPALPGQPCPEVDLRRRPVRLAELRGDPALAAADEQPELVLLAPKRPLDPLPWGPAVPAEGLGGGGVADTSCFPELVSYTIRSSGNFLVWTLLDSGAAYFPHAQTSALTNDQPDEREGHCELVRSPSPLQQSRAWPGIPFKNEAFSFTMQPAPEPWAVAARYPERAWAGAIDPRVHRPPRGTSWQITVQGALNPQRYSLGSLLGGVAVDPVRGRVYVGDSGLERVLEVTLTTGSVTLVSQ